MNQLTNHLWQSTIFAAAVALTAIALHRNSARVRYWLWLTASLKFLIPFSVLVTLGGGIARPTAAPVLPALPVVPALMVERVSTYFAPAPAFPAVTAPPTYGRFAIIAVWAAGALLFWFRWRRRWRAIRSAVRNARPLPVDSSLPALSSPAMMEPGVFGIFRPVLLLPEGIADSLTQRQFRAILAHELCHVRYRDNLTAALHMCVETLFWFHPAVWWIGAKLLEERERACDEYVLKQGWQPADYAQGIVNVCKTWSESPLLCVSGITGASLKKRIREIMTWRGSLHLSFARKSILATGGILTVAVPLVIGVIRAQTLPPPPAPSAFEAAAIKRSTGCGANDNIYGSPSGTSPGRLTLSCATMEGLILGAYSRYANGRTNLSIPPPIQGGPSWINSERYTITAKGAGQESRAMMNGPMLAALLGDRFKLKVRRQIRQVPVFALIGSKSGARLKAFQEGTCTPVDYAQNPPPPAPGQPPYCRNRIGSNAANMRTMHLPGATVTAFSELLGIILDRPVIDRTGIKGRFDIDVEFAIDQSTPGFVSEATPNPTPGLSIFTAIQEQLGMKLESTKGLGEVLVIDHVERPSDN